MSVLTHSEKVWQHTEKCWVGRAKCLAACDALRHRGPRDLLGRRAKCLAACDALRHRGPRDLLGQKGPEEFLRWLSDVVIKGEGQSFVVCMEPDIEPFPSSFVFCPHLCEGGDRGGSWREE
jgi:hypothetical protein